MTTPTRNQRVGMCLLVCLLAFGVACGDDDDETETAGQTATTAAPVTTPTTTGTARITIQNFTFMGIDGASANVPFTIENKDTAPHTVSSVDDKFPVWRVEGGETKTFGSLPPGSYAIRCDVHPARMTGTLVVR